MRRLPIYFLIDVSESMIGEPIQQVEEGLGDIIKTLKIDPQAIETVWISIIIFAGQAKTLVPLQEMSNFYPPKFPIGSGTSLSKGLGHLMFELRKNTVKTTAYQKGDWKPIVFLFTDGVPTDSTNNAIEEWQKNWAKAANMVAISFGREADVQVLSQLTNDVLYFENTSPSSYKTFFKWITASIQANSMAVENNNTSFDLTNLDKDIFNKIDLTKHKQVVDSNFVVLSGKCQNTARPYLMKYKKNISAQNVGGLAIDTQFYKLVGAFPVGESYFELSDSNKQEFKVHTNELLGAPTCPYCGNQFAFAMCICGNIHCVGNEEVSTCPWCQTQGTFGVIEGGFDVNRTQG